MRSETLHFAIGAGTASDFLTPAGIYAGIFLGVVLFVLFTAYRIAFSRAAFGRSDPDAAIPKTNCPEYGARTSAEPRVCD